MRAAQLVARSFDAEYCSAGCLLGGVLKFLSVALCAGATASILLLPVSASAGATYKVLYSFCSQENCPDGAGPSAALIDVQGTLYGTTRDGGVYGAGTVFSVDPDTGTETVLHSFGNGTDGGQPSATLISVKGLLYGTTLYGGAGNAGIVFSVSSKTGAEAVAYAFCAQSNCIDGATPVGGLSETGGLLYGTTAQGGSNCQGPGCGTIFSLDPNTGSEAVLHSFCSENNCADGSYPHAAPVDLGGVLYDTTYQGGAGSDGVVFSLDIATGAETTAFSFGYTDGAFPSAALIDVKGTLYGTTPSGGSLGGGTVFGFDPSTGVETVVHTFDQANTKDGSYPIGGLVYVKGKLFGTTNWGGRSTCRRRSSGCGTVFSIDLSTGKERVIYNFCSKKKCADGQYPAASLINVNGTLYGTTYQGGAYGSGTVFAITP